MKYRLLIFLLAITAQINAQVPQKMSYQAVIRDANNSLLSLKNISMRISILKGEFEPSAVYIEYQNGKTNLNGLVSLQIGNGNILYGNFSKIDWSKGPYYIFTETDPDGGFNYRINGKSELLSVPYALYASKSNFDTTSIYNSLKKLEIQSIINKNDIQNNLDSIIENASHIQTSIIKIASNTVDIEKNIDSIKKNTSDIKTNLDTLNGKINSVDLNILLNDYQKIGKFVSAISLQGVDSFDVNINGNFVASKNVTIGGNIESLGATSTLGTLEKPFKGLFISSGSLSIASDTLGKDIPAAVLSNVEGNLQISAGGLKLMGVNTSFIAPSIISTLTGNASSATKLATSRLINGVEFDGSTDITIATTSANALTYTNTGTGDAPGGSYNGSLAKTISYNSLGASPLAGSTLITTVGALTVGAIPYTLLTGNIPIWNQSTSGNAATVTTNANLTGMVTSVGNMASVVTNANLTGVVSSIGNITSIASGTITNSMIANTAVTNLTGTNTGDETSTSIKTKLGITSLSGDNTGDQILPTLASLGGVASNTSITGATKTKISYDTKGLVTAGVDATTADIAASTNKNYVTDIQAGVISNTSGRNSGDETTSTLKTKLGITTLSGSNTGDQTLPTLETLERSEIKDAPYFSETGILSKLTLSSNNSRDQTEEIDLTKTIHKLSGIGGRNYVLNDGVEGQIIYILPFGDETTISTININIINGTIWNLDNNLLVTSTSEKPIIWTPFSDKRPSVTMVMAIFTENKWFITGGTSTQ